jgi:hypothetical protein
MMVDTESIDLLHDKRSLHDGPSIFWVTSKNDFGQPRELLWSYVHDEIQKFEPTRSILLTSTRSDLVEFSEGVSVYASRLRWLSNMTLLYSSAGPAESLCSWRLTKLSWSMDSSHGPITSLAEYGLISLKSASVCFSTSNFASPDCS